MTDTLYLYYRYAAASVKSQLQYKVSFILASLGQFLATGIEFVAMLVLFSRFEGLAGWSLAEVAFLYGIVNCGFALADAVAHGFDSFGSLVKSGDFDRLLLRPRSTVLQVFSQELTLRRVGRLAQGLAVFIWATLSLEIAWTPAKAGLALMTVGGGAALFSGLMVLQATLAFWTTETLEIMNILTHGGVQATQYPMSIYREWFQRFFIYLVPLACVSYFPVLAILERPDPLGSNSFFQFASPLLGFLFLGVCLQVWKLGVRHYRSTGS